MYWWRFLADSGLGAGNAVTPYGELVGSALLGYDGHAAAPGQVWTGFRFIDVAPEDVAYIREWVDAPGSQYV